MAGEADVDIEAHAGIRDAVRLTAILASAPGPVMGGIPGLTADEVRAFFEAIER